MRDILVTALVFGALPFILWRPYVGILVWSWISYMNPHRLSWGFAYDMPFAAIVACVLFVSMLFTSEKYRLNWNGTVTLWLIFLAWMTLSTVLAIFPDRAMTLYTTVMKIQLLTFITLMLIDDKEKVRQLIWVIVASIGFYSVKGGLFTVLTGGAHRVYGPYLSNIRENNALALATLMLLPLMVYLYQTTKDRPWVQKGLGIAILLSTVSVVGSQSRGAILAMAAVAGFFWLKTSNKLISGTGLLLLAVLIFNFMPQSWHERMGTITSYEEDASAMGRINAWKYSINIASDRLTGGGFNSWSQQTYARYSPEASTRVVAHSIYFAVLADHGWPGLLLFLLLLVLTWNRLSKVIGLDGLDDDPFQPKLLARMLQVSFIAYLSGGAFLSLSYFDLPWHLIAISMILAQFYIHGDKQPVKAEKVLEPRGV